MVYLDNTTSAQTVWIPRNDGNGSVHTGSTKYELEGVNVSISADTTVVRPSSGYYGMSAVTVDASEYAQENYDNGFDDGFNDGYASGTSEGYDEGYDSGYTSGYTSGSTDGYNSGYTSGHTSGVTEGENNIISTFSAFTATTNGQYGSSAHPYTAVTVNVPSGVTNLEQKYLETNGVSCLVFPDDGYFDVNIYTAVTGYKKIYEISRTEKEFPTTNNGNVYYVYVGSIFDNTFGRSRLSVFYKLSNGEYLTEELNTGASYTARTEEDKIVITYSRLSVSEWRGDGFGNYDGMSSMIFHINSGRTFNNGVIEGRNVQKSLMALSAFTENGTYTREDGWSEVFVNVPTNNTEEKSFTATTNGEYEITPTTLWEITYQSAWTDCTFTINGTISSGYYGHNAYKLRWNGVDNYGDIGIKISDSGELELDLSEWTGGEMFTFTYQNGHYLFDPGPAFVSWKVTPMDYKEQYDSMSKVDLTVNIPIEANRTYTATTNGNFNISPSRLEADAEDDDIHTIEIDASHFPQEGRFYLGSVDYQTGTRYYLDIYYEDGGYYIDNDEWDNGDSEFDYDYNDYGNTLEIEFDRLRFDGDLNWNGNTIPIYKAMSAVSLTVNVDTASTYSSGYSSGYTSGYTSGSTDGYNSGYTSGFTDGYASGYSAHPNGKSLVMNYVNPNVETPKIYTYSNANKHYIGNGYKTIIKFHKDNNGNTPTNTTWFGVGTCDVLSGSSIQGFSIGASRIAILSNGHSEYFNFTEYPTLYGWENGEVQLYYSGNVCNYSLCYNNEIFISSSFTANTVIDYNILKVSAAYVGSHNALESIKTYNSNNELVGYIVCDQENNTLIDLLDNTVVFTLNGFGDIYSEYL